MYKSKTEKILCKHCGTEIGIYEVDSGSTLETYDNYTTCDICGEELCIKCSRQNNNLYICQSEHCLAESNNIVTDFEELKSIFDNAEE